MMISWTVRVIWWLLHNCKQQWKFKYRFFSPDELVDCSNYASSPPPQERELLPWISKMFLLSDCCKKLISCWLSEGESWQYKEWQFQGKKMQVVFIWESTHYRINKFSLTYVYFHILKCFNNNQIVDITVMMKRDWWRAFSISVISHLHPYLSSNLIARDNTPYCCH